VKIAIETKGSCGSEGGGGGKTIRRHLAMRLAISAAFVLNPGDFTLFSLTFNCQSRRHYGIVGLLAVLCL